MKLPIISDQLFFKDTIDKWDENKLKEVVEKKHGSKVMPKTEIVCL